MEEIWKPISNFENLYEVSNFGRIRSIDRVVQKKNHTNQKQCFLKGKILKQAILFGYNVCVLCKEGKQYDVRVHRLVAKAFCPDYFDGCEVHHIDENRQNNIYTNLICKTKLEHLSTHGNGMKKIKKVDSVGNETMYDGIRLAAKENGVTHQAIMAVLKGKRPTCLGCRWYYAAE